MSGSPSEPPREDAPPVFQEGCVRLTLDLRVYRLSAVQKASYRFAERFTAILGAPEGHRLSVQCLFREGTRESEALDAVRCFFQELLDQELREQVGDETRAIRALIIAQAFSRTDLIRRD
ncbi:His-Xaa-Ser system protein HxsD [Corallococcus sp. CA053C]|uniref:His-Xaa-Ser system protein HxsD n=1 Tax=Corallococcus sp. CA053C TaxID=2316732 RepID=UPI000EA3BC6D|nr:His-Xaa-Ser system protein HxsD [Corallococcus sp. CA053C]RKH06109.1 His-Xaa-Ser system protein HxsD [Corallococcus sp. CA053C]